MALSREIKYSAINNSKQAIVTEIYSFTFSEEKIDFFICYLYQLGYLNMFAVFRCKFEITT